MPPFLAEVNVIDLIGDATSSAATVRPGAAGDYADAIADLRAIAAQLKAKARAMAAADARQTNVQVKEDADNDNDSDGADKVTINNGTKSIVVHHSKSKSSGDDTVLQAVPIVAIVFTFLYLIVRALMAPFTSRNKRGAQPQVVMEGLSAEEAAILEKLQRTLAQMESRVESLETILIDPAHTKEKYGSKL